VIGVRDSRERVVKDLLLLLRSAELDTTWTSFNTGNELVAEVERIEASLGEAEAAEDLANLFLPTGALQEVALSSGLHDAYMRLASRHDKVAARRHR
jgi:hypothetical protein